MQNSDRGNVSYLADLDVVVCGWLLVFDSPFVLPLKTAPVPGAVQRSAFMRDCTNAPQTGRR